MHQDLREKVQYIIQNELITVTWLRDITRAEID